MTTYWERLASRLPAGGSAALVTSPHNRRYLTGFPSSDGCVLILPDAAYFLTDFRYIEAARRQIRSMECLCYQRLTDTLRELTEKHGVRRLLVEAGQMTLRERRKLRETLSGDVEDGDELDDWLEALRLIKSPDELRRIREAQALTAYGFEKILDYIRPGRTEREIALELEFLIRRQGAEGIAFDFIVVSGANSSLPHGVPSDKAVEPGDFVTMDFGAVVDGWHSDMTRTVAVGASVRSSGRYTIPCCGPSRRRWRCCGPAFPASRGTLPPGGLSRRPDYGGCFGHARGTVSA